MTSPIELAKAATPSWMLAIHDYDGLDIRPVRNVNWAGEPLAPWPNLYPEDHATWCEVCEPHEAHFWSVYGRLKVDLVFDVFEDFPDEAGARAFAARLRAIWPHLRDNG